MSGDVVALPRSPRPQRPVVAWGIALAIAVIAVGLTGSLVLRRKSLDPVSQRTVPAFLVRAAAAVPEGSTIVEQSTRVTPNNYKTVGRIVFVTAVPGSEARHLVAERLGLSSCGEDVYRTSACDAAPGPEDLIVRMRADALSGEAGDPARVELGPRAGEFALGATVVEVIVGTE